MKVTGARARQRALKGWQTRRRGPSVTYKGFNPREETQLRYAQALVEARLKPGVTLPNTTVRKANSRRLESTYKRHTGYSGRRVAALTHEPYLLRRNHIIDIHPRTLKTNSVWDPVGVYTHELGHTLGPNKNRAAFKDFQQTFGYDRRLRPVPGNRARRTHNYQSLNAHEDFAETFRAVMGQKMYSAPRLHEHNHVFTSQTRLNHMNRFYTQ